MAFTIETSWPFSTSVSSTSRTYVFNAIGEKGVDDNEESYKDAMDAVEAHVADNYSSTPDGLVPQNISDCETLGLHPVPRYRVEVEYGAIGAPTVFEPAETGAVEFAFDLTAQSQHINFALENLGQVMAPGKTAPQTTAIGVDMQGVVQGTDILVPTAQFTLDYYPQDSVITNNYLKTVEDMVGKVNDSTFGHRAAGEVFLMGARGSKRSNEDWRIGFTFAVRANRTKHDTENDPPENEFIVSGIEIPFDVKGWDILDPIVEPEEGEDKVQAKVIGFNRLRVYETREFGLLGLPGY